MTEILKYIGVTGFFNRKNWNSIIKISKSINELFVIQRDIFLLTPLNFQQKSVSDYTPKILLCLTSLGTQALLWRLRQARFEGIKIIILIYHFNVNS